MAKKTDTEISSTKALESAREQHVVAQERLKTLQQEKAEASKLHAAWDTERKAHIEHQKTILKARVDLMGFYDEEAQALQKTIESLDAQLGAIQKIRGETKGLIEGITGIGDKWKNTFVGGLLDPATSIEDKMQGIGEGLKEATTFSNLLGSSMMKVQELMVASWIELQTALPAFNAATGQAAAMNDQLIEIANQSRRFGAGMDEAGQSMGASWLAWAILIFCPKKLKLD